MEKKGLKVIQRRIDILESRLARIDIAQWNSVVYSRRDYCLHANLLLGEYSNRFYLLSQDLHRQKEDWEVDHPDKPFPDPGNTWSNDLIDEAWNVLETSYHVAEEHLPANDTVRLCLSYEYCCFLSRYGDEAEEARNLATKVYENASALSLELDAQQLDVLEKIRQDLLVAKRPPALFQTYGEKDTDEEESVEEKENDNEKGTKRILRKKSVKFAELDKLRDARHSVNNRNIELAVAIKRSLGPAVNHPTFLENIPSSSIILKTIDKIFRAYIRGNALPGQLTSGNTVDLAGHNISFGTFVLNGPYMSWKGFLQFLIDFGIAQLPSQQSKAGQKFWRTMSSHNVNPDTAMSEQAMATGGNMRVDPVLTLKEAALVFIQCSGAAFPALISRRTNNQRSGGNNDEEENPNNPDHTEAESWRLVTQWAENDGDAEWEIDVGTNFPQFIDCLGKMGVLAYSKDHFAAILPSVSEKMEHFLSAFLGLTDQRKWFSKVQRKLKTASSAIKDVAERAKAVTSRKAP